MVGETLVVPAGGAVAWLRDGGEQAQVRSVQLARTPTLGLSIGEDGAVYRQAGLKRCRLRCLDAATGDLLWEAPFAGTPSWNRQLPPIVHDGLAIYSFSMGKIDPNRWLLGHGEIPGFPEDHKPMVRAYDLATGEVV